MMTTPFDYLEQSENWDLIELVSQDDVSVFDPPADAAGLIVNAQRFVGPSLVYNGNFAKRSAGRESRILSPEWTIRNSTPIFSRIKGRFDGYPEEFSFSVNRAGQWLLTMDAGEADIFCSVMIWSHARFVDV